MHIYRKISICCHFHDLFSLKLNPAMNGYVAGLSLLPLPRWSGMRPMDSQHRHRAQLSCFRSGQLLYTFWMIHPHLEFQSLITSLIEPVSIQSFSMIYLSQAALSRRICRPLASSSGFPISNGTLTLAWVSTVAGVWIKFVGWIKIDGFLPSIGNFLC